MNRLPDLNLRRMAPSKSKRGSTRLDRLDLAAEILRRAGGTGASYVVRLSDLPTPAERLQLLAAQRERRPIAVMPIKCETIKEWLSRYGSDFRS